MKKTLSLLAALVVAPTMWAAVPFEPAQSADDASAQQYYIYQPGNMEYVKVENGNILGNGFTGDKFIFVESEKKDDTYYIYNVSEQKYIYYTQATGTANTKQTATSAIKQTATKSVANTWKFIADGTDTYDIVPGEVKNITADTEGWNFRGGADCALNLYKRSDNNGSWQIMGQIAKAVGCATRVFSLPGKPFMHKLVMNEGDELLNVTGLPEGLEVKTDRSAYKYIYGVAPSAGEYTYTLHMNDDRTQDVHFTVSEDLAQPTPFMGLLTWNAFGNNINQDVIITLADALVDFGLRDIGYNHMCIDDCWATGSRVSGHLSPDTNKFPDFKGLATAMHERGLKIGIYSDAGSRTCSNAQPGSYGNEKVDAKDFVNWGFDLLKYDFCNATGGTTAAAAEQAYGAMGTALSKAMTDAGRKPSDFKFYMCEWGWRLPHLWAANTGASCWRSTDDTRDFWSDTTYKGGVKQVLGVMKGIWQYQGVNRWNDADMLCVGLHGTGYSSNDGGGDGYKAGMTQDEYRTNFGLWCMFSSPLTLSNNITNLDGKPNSLTKKNVTNTFYEDDLDIITNTEIIALDQDPLGQAGEPIYDDANYIVFQKDMADGNPAISLTNLGSGARTITVKFSDLSALQDGKTYKMRDLWNHAYIDADGIHKKFTKESTFSIRVPSHATYIYRLYDYDAEDVTYTKPGYSEEEMALKEAMDAVLLEAETAYNANEEGAVLGTKGLITDTKQFSTNANETSEGSLSNLLDGDASTFWHSKWQGVSGTEMDKHYLQVALAEPVEGALRCVTLFRKGASADFVTRCRIEGSTDGKNFTEAGSVSLPFTKAGEEGHGDFMLSAPYSTLRFWISETTSNRTYGHFGDFQLYPYTTLSPNMQHPEVAAAMQAALQTAGGKRKPTQADIEALREAYKTYMDAMGGEDGLTTVAARPRITATYDLQGRKANVGHRGVVVEKGKKKIQ